MTDEENERVLALLQRLVGKRCGQYQLHDQPGDACAYCGDSDYGEADPISHADDCPILTGRRMIGLDRYGDKPWVYTAREFMEAIW